MKFATSHHPCFPGRTSAAPQFNENPIRGHLDTHILRRPRVTRLSSIAHGTGPSIGGILPYVLTGRYRPCVRPSPDTSSSTSSSSPLDNLLTQISNSLNSTNSTAGSLQDLASYLIQNGQGTGSVVNTTA